LLSLQIAFQEVSYYHDAIKIGRRRKTMGNKVTTKKEIIKRIMNERNKLSSFGVVDIGLFGSFAYWVF